MGKPRLLITVRGGIIQHIAATSKDVEIQIIDHDNLGEGQGEHALSELDEIHEPDVMMSKRDMETTIKIIKKEYSK